MPHRKYRRRDPRRYIKLAMVRLGRRGNSLVLMGFMYIVQGLIVMGNGGLNLGFDHITGPLWVLAGLVAFYNAPRPTGKDVWGFVALIVMGAWITLLAVLLFIAWLIPGGHPGEPYGLLIASAYAGLFIGWPLNTLGWRENVDVKTGRFE